MNMMQDALFPRPFACGCPMGGEVWPQQGIYVK